MHPPKHETFDLAGRTNTDPKGFVRAVDEYRLCPWGLYMARGRRRAARSSTTWSRGCRRFGIARQRLSLQPGL